MNSAVYLYIFIAYLITWSLIFISFGLYQRGSISFNQLNLVYNFGALGPFLGALITAAVFYGKDGIKKLFATVRFRTITKTSILIAWSPLAFFALGLLIYPLFAGHWYSFADTQQQYNLSTPAAYIYWILPFITYAVFEEFGWRGFMLPHLQENYSALKSTFILTAVWAIWHLPFFLWRFQFSGFIAVGFFFSIFVGSLILTTTFNLSKGSIVSVILFHFTNNLSAALDKEFIVAVVSTGFIFLAIYLVRKYKPENLSDGKRIANFYLSKS